MDRFNKPATVVHQIYDYEYQLSDQQDKIRSLLKSNNKIDFFQIFEACENRIHAIVTFLAMLEMVNLQQLVIIKGEAVNQFWVEEAIPDEPPEASNFALLSQLGEEE